jgi:hypothetical protein
VRLSQVPRLRRERGRHAHRHTCAISRKTRSSKSSAKSSRSQDPMSSTHD